MGVERRRIDRLLTAALTIALSSLLWATTAFATPMDQVMSLSDLQAQLDAASPAPVTGYLKTVLRGSTIETIPVEIIAITSDVFGASNASKALIIFEATGPKIEKIGGIASGMSGSPIYVNDGGVDKVIGALSYGDWFSKNGAGLATPIEAMIAVAGYPTDPKLVVSSLSAPVSTASGLVGRIIVTNDADVAESVDDAYTLVAKPLNTLSIGSLSPRSRGYKVLSKTATERGYNVVPLTAALGTSKASWSVPFEPGASVAALASWGDLWVGGIGTTTYVDSDTVLAFGHPMDWSGSSEFALANAWIDYVWPSSISPFKVGRPGMVRGVVTQDRGAAILGRTDLMSAVTTITSSVLDKSTGNDITGASYMPRNFATGDWTILPAIAAYRTALRACDDYAYGGSAVTTTTIIVSDGVDEYMVTRRNVWDDSYDVAFTMIEDAWTMVGAFAGIPGAQVLSVDFDAVLDPNESNARIVDVEVPVALKSGADNRVTIAVRDSGDPTTRTIDVTLTIPAGTPATGALQVSGTDLGDYWEDEEFDEETPADNVKDAAAALAAMATNSDITVTFAPISSSTGASFKTIETTVSAGRFVYGSVYKETANFKLMNYPGTMTYKGFGVLMGMVENIYHPSTLTIYTRSVESTSVKYLGSVAINASEDEPMAEFEQEMFGFTRNTEIIVRFDGDKDTLRSEASRIVKVRAAVRVTPSDNRIKYGRSVYLYVTTAPSGTTGKVVYEHYRAGAWRTIATKTLSDGRSRLTYKPAKGTTRVRVRYLGSSVNAPRTSYYKTIKAE
jgi:hypothetical protein